MNDQPQKSLGKRFDEQIRFLKGWMGDAKAVGAIAPTSPITARRMASVTDPSSGLPVLELGAGTGAVTKAILERGIAPENLVSVETSADFMRDLRTRFPRVRFVEGDAFDLDGIERATGMGRFDSVVSAIPLLNLPNDRRLKLIESLLDRMAPGRPIVQICYGAKSPIPAENADFDVRPLDWIVRNIPPARLWIFSRSVS
ncbi:phospholipid N-methyltransferase PmtA [Pararhizobium mangrovi]|uniref:Methyltransferase domain-containing protein n=1 Tax=Pararhizobium mangrovi TaxID=2590452 RepID=A0A506TZS2_9HYPH|nr:methyltransferase domain-containing protein [Pararhizobium mangrovi]TPW26471.1 methyltransferase domain-containing protein [Pararhizobium mangrovi]